jgi:molybdopterin/thiamine biosynthesis adenylyltransferase
MLFRAMRDQDEPLLGLVILRPKGRGPMLLRGGPDVAVLRSRSVALVGIGAVGSHVAENLARSGVGKLRMIDYDRIWPVNLIRHAAPPGTPAGMKKTEAMRHALEQYPWVEVEIPSSDEMTVIWTADEMADVLSRADLTIDATGHAGLAELMSRHAARLGRAYISVALFRGGAVARVRRQFLEGDTPIVQRPHLDRYLKIPPLDEEAEYVGTEVGCLSRVHNAPPVAVVRAGALAADVAIDLLTGRNNEPDEVVEVFRRGDPPFDRLGRIRPEEFPVTVDVSEAAQAAIRVASRNALPNETGGILVGCVIDGRPTIVDASEIPDPGATPKGYHLANGKTVEAVEAARRRDPRLGYLGEWHSHPSVGDPSPLDTATMAANSAVAGVEHPVLIVSYPQGSPEGQDLRVFATSPFRLRATSMVTTGGLPPHEVVEKP